MFIFDEFSTYNLQQIESVISRTLILPQYLINEYSVASVKDLFVFEMGFISTREGVIVGIETGEDKNGYTLYAIYEKQIQKSICGWWVNGGDVWEVSARGERQDVSMQLNRLFDTQGKFHGLTRYRFIDKSKYTFSSVFSRQIQIEELLQSL